MNFIKKKIFITYAGYLFGLLPLTLSHWFLSFSVLTIRSDCLQLAPTMIFNEHLKREKAENKLTLKYVYSILPKN